MRFSVVKEIIIVNNLRMTTLNLNSPSFKSSFRSDEVIQGYIEKASNADLLDFYKTLGILKNDGKDDVYFVKESEFEVFNPVSTYCPKYKKPELILYKQNSDDMKSEKIESIVLGGMLFETTSKNVISELARILRRKNDIFETEGLRNNLIKKINQMLK